jgi:CO/xanthine dehydrogenase FAD-binding subunit
MIIEYHRPDELDQALELLARSNPVTVPLGGGTLLNQPSDSEVAVVDLQALGLDQLKVSGKNLDVGAATPLQALLDFPEIHPALAAAIRHEATYNLRQMATVAGALVAADGRSPFASVMLALNAEVTMLPDTEKAALGEWLPLRNEKLAHKLITQIRVPIHVKLAYDYVARTPADLAIVSAAVAQWPSGRTRVVLGGYGASPLLAMDGPNSQGVDIAARDAYREAGDQWASAEYRSDVAAKLARRCVEMLSGD